MSRANRITLIILAIIGILIVGIAIFFLNVTRSPFPKTNGRLRVEGLQEEVNIYRDEYGVPHIYAENEHDMLFAQGYVHAQDRFWQMEFWRHTSQGRLAEIAGPDLVDTDKFIRTVGWHRSAQATVEWYEENDPDYLNSLQSYADGVNAYLADNADNMSFNQTILNQFVGEWEIEPWEPIDTIAWGVVMAWDLGGNWSTELRIAEMNQILGEATTELLLPRYPEDTRPVIAPTDDLISDLEAYNPASTNSVAINWNQINTDIVGETPNFLGLAMGTEGIVGSNNWVVSGDHTDTGMPLLANDPHLGIQMPAIWYEVGLHSPGWDVTGFSFAGVPGVIIGHNERIAWGVTNVGPDVQDLCIEKINPENGLQYEYDGEWHNMEVIEEVIKVNGGEDEVIEVKMTNHGPVMNDVRDGLTDVLTLQWTAHEPSTVLQAVFMLNQASNHDEFREALQFFDVPAQNFVYADVDGNIAYQTPGRIPIRNNHEGLFPTPGWDGTCEWDGYIPYESLPAMLNPDTGYIVTANNAVVDSDYPYLINVYWADGDRAQRIVDMIDNAIEQNGHVTSEDFAAIHHDSYSLVADEYIPLLNGLSSSDSRVQAAIERLRGWDRQQRRDSVPAALFEIFYMHLATATLQDELGEAEDLYLSNGSVQRVFFRDLASQPNARWWDNVDTDDEESREDIILQALEDTIDWFEENVGDDVETWTWGNLHTATFVSNPVGQSGTSLVENMVNRGPFPADGGSGTVNANGWGWGNPAEIRGHPSMRMIVDLSDFEASLTVLPTGQSGHPFHKHYDDMIQLWLNGEYHPMLFSRDVVEDAAEDHLRLQPQN